MPATRNQSHRWRVRGTAPRRASGITECCTRLLQELGDDGFGPRRAALRQGPEANFALASFPLLAEGREGLALGAAPQELVAELEKKSDHGTFGRSRKQLTISAVVLRLSILNSS